MDTDRPNHLEDSRSRIVSSSAAECLNWVSAAHAGGLRRTQAGRIIRRLPAAWCCRKVQQRARSRVLQHLFNFNVDSEPGTPQTCAVSCVGQVFIQGMFDSLAAIRSKLGREHLKNPYIDLKSPPGFSRWEAFEEAELLRLGCLRTHSACPTYGGRMAIWVWPESLKMQSKYSYLR